MKESGVLEGVIRALEGMGKEVVHFTVPPEPRAEDVDLAREEAEGCDLVIGMGGGSVLDVAKATASLIGEKEPTWKFLLRYAIPSQPPLPIIAIPTTAGTGSEVTQVSVLITERDGERIKTSINHPHLLPLYAIEDPTLLATCPPQVIASAGVDALSHSLESYFSIASTPLSEPISLQGTALVLNNLEEAYKTKSEESLEKMMWGSLLGGIALSQARLGAVHALAHSLGALKGIPHGIACGLFLPYVLEFNRESIGNKMENLLRYLGIEDLSSKLDALLSDVGIPRRLKEVGVKEEDIEPLVKGCRYSHSLRFNPRPLSEEDLRLIIESAL